MSDSCCRALGPGPDEPPPPPPEAVAPSTPPPTAARGFQRRLLLPLQPLTPSPPRRQPPAAAAAAAANARGGDAGIGAACGGSKKACTPTPTPPPLPANATTATAAAAAAAKPKAPPAVAIRGLLRPLRGPPKALLLSWRLLLPLVVLLLPPSLIRPGQSAMLRSIRLTHPRARPQQLDAALAACPFSKGSSRLTAPVPLPPAAAAPAAAAGADWRGGPKPVD